MENEIFIVVKTDETDESGKPIYFNKCWNVRGNAKAMRDYARKHHYGAGVKYYPKVHRLMMQS